MCEWLSCREWCDVRLQCGGRAFAAHRAVLASVSAFLRRILLSCPTEDSPTSIVLPDFDLDAMSSVLYYIYNGEVVIQKKKLEMFMEIVNAMQIFVDEHCLPSSCKGVELVAISTTYDHRISERSKVFCIGEDTGGSYVNLKKEYKPDCSLLKKSDSESEFGDKQIRSENWTTQALGNMESACGDRQRSFLRDLFMETYPRNGNANGRAWSVPAIQSARYRGPASQPLTNANGKHLRVDDSHETNNALHIPQTLHHMFPLSQNANHTSNHLGNHAIISSTELTQMKKHNSAFSYFNPKPLSGTPNNNLNNCLLEYFSTYQMQNGLKEMMKVNRVPPIDVRPHTAYINQRILSTSCSIPEETFQSKNVDDTPNNTNMERDTKITSSKNILTVFSKTTVLNEVLDSPWRPRQPTNYKPFRRKVQQPTSISEVKECAMNDNNNNIRTSPSPEVSQRISASATTIESAHVSELAVGSDFKCTICEQVFTKDEALSAHVRRHSSPARYSCTECSKSFSQLRNFKYHMSVHRGTREFAATCTVCGKYFNDRGYLSSHMKIHRNRKEYKCPQCPKSFNQRVAYNMHVRIHTGIKPHVCNECGKAFSRKMLLKQHQRTHSGERPYACTHCDKRFADRSNMTLHLRLHSGVKPFSCTLCPKSFTKKHHLKSHLNFHTGAKPYSCPKCKLAFTQSSNMRTHLKKCTAPDPTENADVLSSS